jgi:hypothetical protein
VPEERDEPGLRLEVEGCRRTADLAVASLVLGPRERDGRRECREEHVPFTPPLRNPSNVLDETDRTDDRRRIDRAAVRLVVQRHVSGDDREVQDIAGGGDPVDRGCEFPSDLRLLRIPEVEAVREPIGSPPTHATLRAASKTASAPP